jgi:N utilization substance protein B
MTRRSRAREVALQLLYQHDLNPTVERPAIEQFVRERLRDPAVEPFTLGLFDGVLQHGADIDRRLAAAAENWRLARMAAVDRNVLRLGAYELLQSATPAGVVLNEAIELARRYGSLDSPGFVNGVLDRLNRTRPTPETSPPRQQGDPDTSPTRQQGDPDTSPTRQQGD